MQLNCLLQIITDMSGNYFAGTMQTFTLMLNVNEGLLHERNTLIQFYNATGGNDWIVTTNWAKAGNPCEKGFKWHGVGCYDPCDARIDGGISCLEGRITTLSLPRNNLTGNASC